MNYNTIATAIVPGQAAWNNAVNSFLSGNYGSAVLSTVQTFGETALFVATWGQSSATTPALNNGTRLVHLTDSAGGAGVNASQVLRGNTYAGPLANANASGANVVLRTGLSSGAYEAAVPIPAAAQGAFSQVIPIGPITAWQRVMGQQYTANGILDLTSGAFTRTGVNWNQVGFYTLDAAFTGAVGYSILANE